MTQPNIVYLHSHDTGRFIQPYGHAVATPNLQRLAEDGVLFRQAFCAAPTCSPSRAALLTGQSAHSSGMLGLAHRGFSLNDYSQHLIHTLHAVGYTSVLGGMQHVAAHAETIGYQQILTTLSSQVADVSPAVKGFLAGSPMQPFFLDVGFFETHREFPDSTPEDDARYTQPAPGLPDTADTRADMAAYHASARILDDGVGTVLAALDEHGLADNTLIISTTDHGIAFPGHKCNLTDRGIGVSLILRGPGDLRGGKVIDGMVSHIDIFPSICDLLGIERPSWLQGESILPLIGGEVDEVNEAIFAEVTYHAAYEPQRAVRTPRYKYIRRYGDHRTPVLPNVDDSPSKDIWLSHGWADHKIDQEQLYDLVFDPAERQNLATDPGHAAVLADLRVRLATWMQETNDPLLQGVVPAPCGAKVNDASGLSPREEPREVDDGRQTTDDRSA
ncbi:sulfatase-like hydrolase/transferase [bacterium]|nr:sulfatase-like hydrolase/transferase [bacterium]